MSVLQRHPLVRADLSEAINWYEDQQPGLGLEFFGDFLSHYRHWPTTRNCMPSALLKCAG